MIFLSPFAVQYLNVAEMHQKQHVDFGELVSVKNKEKLQTYS